MKNKNKNFISIYVYISFVIFLLIMTKIFIDFDINIFHYFKFTKYSIPAFLAFISNIGILTITLKKKRKNNITFAFNLLVISLLLWSLIELLLRATTQVDVFIFLDIIIPFGWFFAPIFFLAFALVYTGNFKKAFTFKNIILFSIPAITFFSLLLTTPIIQNDTKSVITLFSWGYDNPPGIYWKYFVVWYELIYIFGFIELLRYVRKTKNILEKKQINIILVSVLIVLILGTMTDALLPVIGIDIMPLAVSFSTIMSIGIVIALVKYNLFTINPFILSENVFRNIDEIIVITDMNFNIKYINETGLKFINKKDSEILNSKLYNLIYEGKDVISETILYSIIKNSNLIKDKVFNIKLKNKKIKNVNIKGEKIENEGLDGYMFILKDVDELYLTNKKLEEKIQQIETINRNMVNREMKMLELKRQIKELQKDQ